MGSWGLRVWGVQGLRGEPSEEWCELVVGFIGFGFWFGGPSAGFGLGIASSWGVERVDLRAGGHLMSHLAQLSAQSSALAALEESISECFSIL